MSKFFNRITIGAAMLVAAAVLLSLPTGDRRVTVADAAGTCPISFRQSGSTTVAEYSIETEAPFEQTGGRTGPTDKLHWGGGTDFVGIYNGSNDGIKDLQANLPGQLIPAPNGQSQGGQSSAKPKLSGSTNSTSGNDLVHNYWWNVANDAFAMVVSNNSSMDFAATYGLTMADMTQVWTAGAGITALHWDELGSVVTRGLRTSDPGHAVDGFPHTLILPAFRTASGGSYSDFISKVASTTPAIEETTYQGLYGLDGGANRNLTSALMAQQAQTPFVLAYTSLSQLATHTVRVIPMAAAVGGPYIIANDTNIATLPSGLQRLMYVGTHDKTTISRVDNSAQVRLDDWINLSRSSQGHAIWAAAGYPVIPPAPVDAIPDYDVDLNSTVSLNDLLMVSQRWGASATCIGWIRNDVNNDGKVSLADIGAVINKWGIDGLICDPAHSCLDDPADGAVH